MSGWLEHSVQIEVETPVERAWALWSDLEKMPLWMEWIESVQILPEDPELSEWLLKSGRFEFRWRSRIVKLIPFQIIQWESIDGLPNRGAIRFYDRKDHCIVRLSVAYDIPGPIGQWMDSLFLGRLVETNLQGNLARFRDYALNTPS